MNTLALISIFFGTIIFLSRIPFISSPGDAIVYYKNIVESNTARRVISIGIFLTGLAMIISAQESNQIAAYFISIFGWGIAFFSFIGVIGNLFFASFFKEFAVSVIESMNEGFFMSIGLIVGMFFIGLGIGLI